MPLVDKLSRNVRDIVTALQSGPEERRAVRRRYTFDAMRLAAPIVGVQTREGWMLVPTADRTVGRGVYVRGGWESDLLPRAVALAEELGGRPVRGRAIVEVGANIGTTTIPAAAIASRVVAVEPSVDNLRLLRANVAINDLQQVKVVSCAASDVTAVGKLTLSDVNWGDNRVGVEGGSNIDVLLRRLDDVLDECGVHPSDVGLLWSDTQGHEGQVLRGAPRLLTAAPPTVVEYWPEALAQSGGVEQLHAVMLEHFTMFIDLGHGDKPEPLPVIAERNRDRLTDLLLLRP